MRSNATVVACEMFFMLVHLQLFFLLVIDKNYEIITHLEISFTNHTHIRYKIKKIYPNI